MPTLLIGVAFTEADLDDVGQLDERLEGRPVDEIVKRQRVAGTLQLEARANEVIVWLNGLEYFDYR